MLPNMAKMLCLVLFLLVDANYLQAVGFKVTGDLSCEKYAGSNSVIKQRWTFEASVLNKQWLLKITSTNGQESIFGCDGQDVYFMLQDPAAQKRLKLSSYVGCVFGGQYPVQSPYISTALPWIAYCSGNYLAENVINDAVILPAPWLSAWAMPVANIYKAHYEPIKDGRGLPMRLEYMPDHERMENMKRGVYHTLTKTSDSERDRVLIQISSYYVKVRKPEAIYQVVQTTNIQGVVLPSEFYFDNFQFKKIAKNSEDMNGILHQRMRGRLTSFVMIDSINPLPESSDKTKDINVGDYRFASPQSKTDVLFVRYIAKNAQWITNKSDSHLQDLYLKEINIHRNLLATKLPSSRNIVLVTFGLTTLLPLIFMIYHKVKKQNRIV